MSQSAPQYSFSEIKIRMNHKGILPYDPRVVGWASVVLNDNFKLNDMVIMEDRSGNLVLRFPTRKSREGDRHEIFYPIRRDIHRALEKEVLGRLNEIRRNQSDLRSNPKA